MARISVGARHWQRRLCLHNKSHGKQGAHKQEDKKERPPIARNQQSPKRILRLL
jgi:hypothetical protein